jgi:hypothetical protein
VPHASREHMRRRLRPLAPVKSAVEEECTLSEEKSNSAPSAAADNPRKTQFVSNMDSEKTPRHDTNNFLTCIPFDASASLANSVEICLWRTWAPRAPNFVSAKGMKRMSGRLRTPSVYLSNFVFSTQLIAASGDKGLNKRRINIKLQ